MEKTLEALGKLIRYELRLSDSMVELSISPVLLLCIGILMFFVSFAPIKQYEPLVIISKHFKMPKNEKVKEKRNGYQELVIQLIVGIAMLIIEYSVFVK